MEYFDLVNEKDEVIGTTYKEKAHKEGEIHRIVAIFVFDKQGRLYVQEHMKSGGKYDHSVGGHVSKGETYDQAAKREGKEELNIKDPLTFVCKFYSAKPLFGKKSIHVFGIYETHVSENWIFTPNDEVKNIIPLELTEIVEMMNNNPEKFTTGFIRTMKEYITSKNLPLHLNY